MSGIARIFGVFFEPGKTFEDIAQRPGWLLPVLLIIICSIAFTVTFTQHVGWEHMMRQQMENSPRTAQMTAEQREQAIQQGARFAPIMGYVAVVFMPTVGYLIMAAVLLAMTAMMSAGIKFKQVFAVVCYSGLPGIIFGLLGMVVMFLKKPEDFNIQNPLMFNVGAFMDPQGGSKFVYSLATSIDLFSFWMIFLIATGLKAAAGKRLSFGGAMTAVIVPWALYVLVKSGLAGMFS
jgi:Yip1 domain